jgi:valyl-tRNA synthetase
LHMAVGICKIFISFFQYNFPTGTSALYNFWLYELCDVYLEYLKPVFASGSPEAVTTARTVLNFCLDNALRLISPFMPFISEELYQRLPKATAANNGTVSITVAEYPKNLPFRDETLEKQVEFVQKISAVVRNSTFFTHWLEWCERSEHCDNRYTLVRFSSK